jgi:5'-methylthioadenosine phosphorylase
MADAKASVVLGVLGGSGVYDLANLEDARWQRVESPFGEPSDELLSGRIAGCRVVFLPRHGRGHRIPPSEINYRANIDALKRLGVTDLVSVSACGSLRESLAPGTFVLVDQFIDRTFARAKSFFGSGCVAHVPMANPVCSRFAGRIRAAASTLDLEVVQGGTYVAIEGPQFSTRAESELYRAWGCDVIGMTNMPEAKLAREAEICYASLSMVTDYDCWHDDHADVDVAEMIAVLTANADAGRALVAAIAAAPGERPSPCPEGCDRSLDAAIITDPGARDASVVSRLDAVAGRVLRSAIEA